MSVGWVITRLDSVTTNNLHLHQRAVFYYSIVALLVGTQLFAAGLLAELFTAFYRRDWPPYSIRERIGLGGARPLNTFAEQESLRPIRKSRRYPETGSPAELTTEFTPGDRRRF